VIIFCDSKVTLIYDDIFNSLGECPMSSSGLGRHVVVLSVYLRRRKHKYVDEI